MKTAIGFIVGFLFALMLTVGTRQPAQFIGIQPVQAQATGSRTTWTLNQVNAARAWISVAESQVALDGEYVSNNYSGTLAIGDLTGSLSGLTVANVTNGEGNLTGIAKAILTGTGLPLTVATGTNTNIQTLAAGGTIK